jgi:hypothetical protein
MGTKTEMGAPEIQNTSDIADEWGIGYHPFYL